MPALQMAPNVPVKMTIKFVDVYANDITKNSGKGYGSQVAVKGKVDGVDQTIYLKGFTNENLGQLQDVGVIAKQHYPHDPAEKYNVPVVGKMEVTLCLDQPAGQKWPKMKITNGASALAVSGYNHPSGKGDHYPADEEGLSSGYLPGDENYETPKPNGKPVVADAPTKRNDQWTDLVQKYGDCLDSMKVTLGARQIKLEDSAFVAAVATLYISRIHKGV